MIPPGVIKQALLDHSISVVTPVCLHVKLCPTYVIAGACLEDERKIYFGGNHGSLSKEQLHPFIPDRGMHR